MFGVPRKLNKDTKHVCVSLHQKAPCLPMSCFLPHFLFNAIKQCEPETAQLISLLKEPCDLDKMQSLCHATNVARLPPPPIPRHYDGIVHGNVPSARLPSPFNSCPSNALHRAPSTRLWCYTGPVGFCGETFDSSILSPSMIALTARPLASARHQHCSISGTYGRGGTRAGRGMAVQRTRPW